MLKKNYLIILIMLVLLISSCEKKEINEGLSQSEFETLCESVTLPTEVSSSISLPKSIDEITISWVSDNESIITNEGEISKASKDNYTLLTAYFSYLDYTYEKYFPITVLKYSDIDYLEMCYKTIEIPENLSESIFLQDAFPYGIKGTWESSNQKILSNTGEYVTPDEVTNLTLSLTLSLNETSKTYEYHLTTNCYSNIERLNDCLSYEIVIPSVVYQNLNLLEEYPDDIKASWTSSNTDVINAHGVINTNIFNDNNTSFNVTLKVELERKSERIEKEYMITVKDYDHLKSLKKDHHIIYRIDDFLNSGMTNVQRVNNEIVLNSDALEGTYESEEISTNNFHQLIGSFAGVTNNTSTIELAYSCKVNGIWSKYASYNPWGKGNSSNGTTAMNDGLIKMSEDEIIVLNNKEATAFKFKLTFRRASLEDTLPSVRIVSTCLWFDTNYTYSIDSSLLPNGINYNVPTLCQNIVPTIGGSICSPTSSTMLLKYKGESFTKYDTYEHRYIAGLVYDHGSNIYGNWVYNCNTIASFGYNAYVGIMYSLEELMYHLAYVGPVALSIKGKMVSKEKTYTKKSKIRDLIFQD